MREPEHNHPCFDEFAANGVRHGGRRPERPVSSPDGYTLVEVVVTMLIFGIVMTLICLSFNRIVTSSAQVIKAVETDIGGLIGLELLRVDLGYAGFGLPWSLPAGFKYSEAQSRQVGGHPSTDVANFNDDNVNGVSNPPRAFVMQNDQGVNGSDYLVLKGTAVGAEEPCRSWSFLTYSTGSAVIKPAKSPSTELVAGKGVRVTVMNSGIRGGESSRDLVTLGSTFCLNFDTVDRIDPAFLPKSPQDRYLVYGIAPAPKNNNDKVTFPFNRTDYYLGPSNGPSSERRSINCAPGTAVLYKGLVNQNGTFSSMPILDCVGDLQVIFMLDTSNDGIPVPTNDISVDTLTGPTGLFPTVDPAQALREHVKEVRVYVLAQQGKKDLAYHYPVGDPNQVIVLGDAVNGKAWSQSALAATFGHDWFQYHWKVYTIAVQPKNLE